LLPLFDNGSHPGTKVLAAPDRTLARPDAERLGNLRGGEAVESTSRTLTDIARTGLNDELKQQLACIAHRLMSRYRSIPLIWTRGTGIVELGKSSKKAALTTMSRLIANLKLESNIGHIAKFLGRKALIGFPVDVATVCAWSPSWRPPADVRDPEAADFDHLSALTGFHRL